MSRNEHEPAPNKEDGEEAGRMGAQEIAHEGTQLIVNQLHFSHDVVQTLHQAIALMIRQANASHSRGEQWNSEPPHAPHPCTQVYPAQSAGNVASDSVEETRTSHKRQFKLSESTPAKGTSGMPPTT